jgi:hypothetical protein
MGWQSAEAFADQNSVLMSVRIGSSVFPHMLVTRKTLEAECCKI